MCYHGRDLEICFGTNNPVYLAYERDGTVTPGFPTPMAGGAMVSGSCISDVDNNGTVNICAHENSGQVHLWELSSAIHPDRLPWARPHHDDHHTGLYLVQDPAGIRPEAVSGRTIAASALRVGPNPTSGEVCLLVSGPVGPIQWSLWDVKGRRLALGNGEIARLDLDRAAGMRLPSGMYYLRAFSGRTEWMQPVVLSR